MKNAIQDKLNSMIDNIITKIENNETGSWFKAWQGASIPTNYKTDTYYNGFNILVLLFEAQEKEYSSNYWLTFKQIKELKGTVKKGEKSTPIFFFKPLTIKEENENGEEEEKTIPLLKSYNVFNLDQTDIEIGNKSAKFDGEIEKFISNLGLTIKTAPEAFYSPEKDYIGIPDISLFDSVDNYYSVLCHEISHSTGHKTRLDRDLTGNFGSVSYAKEELIAELGSVFLCSYLGIQSSIRHEAYLKGWLKAAKEDSKFLWKSASQAQKVLNFCLELQEKEEAA